MNKQTDATQEISLVGFMALNFLVPFAMAGRMPTRDEREWFVAKVDEPFRSAVLGAIEVHCRRAEEIAGLGARH